MGRGEGEGLCLSPSHHHGMIKGDTPTTFKRKDGAIIGKKEKKVKIAPLKRASMILEKRGLFHKERKEKGSGPRMDGEKKTSSARKREKKQGLHDRRKKEKGGVLDAFQSS